MEKTRCITLPITSKSSFVCFMIRVDSLSDHVFSLTRSNGRGKPASNRDRCFENKQPQICFTGISNSMLRKSGIHHDITLTNRIFHTIFYVNACSLYNNVEFVIISMLVYAKAGHWRHNGIVNEANGGWYLLIGEDPRIFA